MLRTTKKTLIALLAADNEKQGASPEASAQQRPTRAPEPPTKNQAEAANAAPAKSSEQEKCDTATTVAFDVGLRSLVLSICTDSVCVGLRMMERFQQYQQHAHRWQGRPQASACSAATLVYQIDSGQAVVVSVDLMRLLALSELELAGIN